MLNHTFIKLHEYLDDKHNTEVTHRTSNLFAAELRYIWIFSDAPHLMKTTRNCVYNSVDGKHTRRMCNNGLDIMWRHIRQIVEDNTTVQLHKMHKITSEHINLTSYSTMNVGYAVEVLRVNIL